MSVKYQLDKTFLVSNCESYISNVPVVTICCFQEAFFIFTLFKIFSLYANRYNTQANGSSSYGY